MNNADVQYPISVGIIKAQLSHVDNSVLLFTKITENSTDKIREATNKLVQVGLL
ncbi:hypothetical protein J6590_101412, partial [Homalodisca vitripennis]